MFAKPPTPPTPVQPAAQPKPVSVGEVKQPSAMKPPTSTRPSTPLPTGMPAAKPAAPQLPSKGVTPMAPSKLANELYGDAKLPDLPSSTPYEVALEHSYWDKQYA